MRTQIQSFYHPLVAALLALGLLGLSGLTTSCGDGAKKEKDRAKKEQRKIIEPEPMPSYINAIDLTSRDAICAKADEIAAKNEVSVTTCDLTANTVTLAVKKDDASVTQAFDLTQRIETLFESTRGLTPVPVNTFYKEFLFSVWLSKTSR